MPLFVDFGYLASPFVSLPLLALFRGSRGLVGSATPVHHETPLGVLRALLGCLGVLQSAAPQGSSQEEPSDRLQPPPIFC